ncbi:A24 family peptidase [Phenylobacterium sp. LH3H17]|uniref:prepilin peptidase n=1 Tax=Phenylobacterium sp. LH3H17 TaxID=2903901 RepID=UPI0020C9A4DC|nr:A24 family peptidase [Phenylobacterium sp. LH3H17]UTP39758.1 A24 family peptidase [Phenylobacterium sp. LH3H17]
MTPAAPALVVAGLAGLALGSFSVTGAVRFERAGTARSARSACDRCAAPLGFAETLPLVSYLRQAGACRSCGGAIDPIHVVGEVAGCAVLVSAMFAEDPRRGLLIAALGLLLIASAAIDWRTQRLPDRLTVAMAAVGATLAWTASPDRLLEGLAAAGLTLAILLGLRAVRGRFAADPGLGLGDVKLLGALALWLGAATPWAVALAAGFGLLLGRIGRDAEGRIPFGPAIALGAWCVGVASEVSPWPMTA